MRAIPSLIKTVLLLLTTSIFLTKKIYSQNAVGIGTATPSSSAMLDISSANKGLLFPRITLTSTVSNLPLNAFVAGMIIYNTASNNDVTPGYYSCDGSKWVRFSDASSAWNITGNVGTNPGNNFFGTIDDNDLLFKRNNYRAGYVGINNTSWGFSAFGAAEITGIQNSSLGAQSLQYNGSGDNNSAVGFAALIDNIDGNQNTAIGSFSLDANVSGSQAVAIGYGAMQNISNTAFAYTLKNVAIGFEALKGLPPSSNNNGNANTGVGYYALTNNSSGGNNAALGESALRANNAGSNNTAVGTTALNNMTTGSFNTAVGASSYPSITTLANFTALGYFTGTSTSVSNSVEIGNTSVTSIKGQVAFSTYSDQRIKDNIRDNVPGLSFIEQLKPVTYNLNIHRQNAMLYGKDKPDTANWNEKYDIEKMTMTGFLAQDVAAAADKVGYNFSGITRPVNENDLYTLRYQDFIMPMVKAIQEQQSIIETQNEKIAAQEVKIERLMKLIK